METRGQTARGVAHAKRCVCGDGGEREEPALEDPLHEAPRTPRASEVSAPTKGASPSNTRRSSCGAGVKALHTRA